MCVDCIAALYICEILNFVLSETEAARCLEMY